MTFALFPILFEYVDSIFYLLENSRFFQFSIVGFATLNADFQVWRSFWVPLTLFFQNILSNLSSAKNAAINLHYSLMQTRFCNFSRKPTNLRCQRFQLYWLKFPLLLPKCFMVQKCDISAFKRTFNHVHISLRSGDILDNISIVGLLASLFQGFHMYINMIKIIILDVHTIILIRMLIKNFIVTLKIHD